MTLKDQNIINHILNYICSETRIENEVANFINEDSNGVISKKDFHNWIEKHSVYDN